MTHNQDKYPDPMRFMPERYIDAKGGLTDDIAEQQIGFGRRCVARRPSLSLPPRSYATHTGFVWASIWQRRPSG